MGADFRSHKVDYPSIGLKSPARGENHDRLGGARFQWQPWRECGVTGRITPTGVVGGFVTAKAGEFLIAVLVCQLRAADRLSIVHVVRKYRRVGSILISHKRPSGNKQDKSCAAI